MAQKKVKSPPNPHPNSFFTCVCACKHLVVEKSGPMFDEEQFGVFFVLFFVLQSTQGNTEPHSRAVQSVPLWCPVSAEGTLHSSSTWLLILCETYTGRSTGSTIAAGMDESPSACLFYGRTIQFISYLLTTNFLISV